MLSNKTLGLLHQIHNAILQLKEWNKDVLSSDDYYCSPEGMKNLAASCMLIEAIGESVKQIDKITILLITKYLYTIISDKSRK